MVRKIFLPGAIALLIGCGGVGVANASPVPLSDEIQVNVATAGDQQAPKIATCNDGSFVAVWQGPETGGTLGIFARRFDRLGSPLGGEIHVNTTTAGSQAQPAVAMNGSCDFVVAWEGPDTSGSGIFVRRFVSGGAAATAETLANTTTAGAQNAPTVAFIDDGDMLVAWRSEGQDGDSGGIYAAIFHYFLAPSSGEFRVNTTTAGEQGDPAATSTEYPEPVYYVVWEGPDGNGKGVFLQQIGRKGILVGPEIAINTTTVGDQENPAVAASNYGTLPALNGPSPWPPFPNDANRVVVVWQGPLADHLGKKRIFFRQLDIGGVPIGSEGVFDVDPRSSDQVDPDVSMGDTPLEMTVDPIPFIAVWSEVDQRIDKALGTLFICGNHGPSSPPFAQASPEFDVSSRSFTSGASAVAVTPGGDFYVVWQSQGQDAAPTWGIEARRFQDTPAFLTTKSVSGGFTTGSTATYEIVLASNGPTLPSHAGDELFDVLPVGLVPVSATASSGTTTITGNTVHWNGGLAANASVDITITATVSAVTGPIVNQARVPYDYDGNGSYESVLFSDDPYINGSANPTRFEVRLFGDGFETGDTSRWSLTLP